MPRIQTLGVLLCVFSLLAPPLDAQSIRVEDPGKAPLGFLTRSWRASHVTPIDLKNSSRLEALIRGGTLYLSLDDAIALAIENNLDVAVQRYGPLIAQQDLRRAQSGGLNRGVSSAVTAGPTSAGTPTLALVAVGASSTAGSGLSQLGPTVPALDPVLSGNVVWQHITSPQSNIFQYGTSALVTNAGTWSAAISKNWLAGTNAALTVSNAFVSQNTYLNAINPSRTATLDLTINQPLLQGLSVAVNNRYIRIARNEVKIADIVFKEQVTATVASIIGLYWDLVSFNDAVDFAKKNMDLSQKTYSDNQKQVSIGTLAPIEVTRAEAQVAAQQQALTLAQTNVLQQETILKNALSKDGVLSPLLVEARVVPTDRIRIPKEDSLPPLGDLFAEGLANRPELIQSQLTVENSKIQLRGTKAELLPSLSLFIDLTNHGLAGQVNTIAGPFQILPDAYFIGGNGTAFAQLFRRNFPDYRIGVSLNIPFRNRAAQSDYVHDQLTLRQAEISVQGQANQIRQDVEKAWVSLRQARAQYEAAVKQRILQEQTLDGEQKKFNLGTSTTFLVVQAQRDLAQAQSAEVTAESTFERARVNMDVATGRILSVYRIDIEQAKAGHGPPRQANSPGASTPQGDGR